MKFLLLSLVACFAVHAAVIEAPLIPFDYEQNPSDINWKHIETENFNIIFPSHIEAEAQRAAHLLEKAFPYVTRSLEVKPPRLPLILQSQSVSSNGFVTLAPRRSEWYVTPATDPELGNTEWLHTLAIHEFRHVVQFEKSRRGFNKAYEFLLGQVGQALGLGLMVPPWYLEGDAVGMETALTRGGRGRLPLFDRDLRTLLLSGKKWNYDKAHLGSYEDYVPNHYVYGYFYTSWLRNEYGDLFLSKLADRSAYDTWNPLTFYNSVDSLTGEKFEKFYDRAMADLIQNWKERADKLTPTPYTVKNLGKRFGWTNYFYPQALENGKIVALKKGLSFIDQFVLIDGKKEKTVFYPGVIANDYPYKLRGNKLAYVELELDPRWGYRDYSRIKVYDFKKNDFVFDKRKTKARLAVLDHKGQNVLYVKWDDHQRQYIVVVTQKNKVIVNRPYSNDHVITSIDWLSNNEVVLVTKDRDSLKQISSVNLKTGAEKILLPKSLNNIGFLNVHDGHILYESPESGIDNIFVLSADGPRQITSALFGAYAPAIKNDKLVYNDYTVNGMNVVEKTLPWEDEQRSSDSFYPIYEKFSKSENIQALETDLLKKEKLKSKKYSQFKNSINLHSWIILAPPLSNTITLMGVSRDVLNKFTLAVGADYNLNEQTTTGFVSSAWTHNYVVADMKGAYGTRSQDIRRSGRIVENKWEEGTFEAGLSVPWKYIQGRFLHSFTARTFAKVIKVTNKRTNDVTEMRDGALFSPGVDALYAVYSRLARRDINPAWGLMSHVRFEEGRDISGDSQRGSLTSIDNRVFLPGLWHHHSFYHQFAYEKQRDKFYQYSSFIFYPRGTRSVYLDELTKYSANYTFPLFYPDWNLSRYLYFKRIALNLFYDELNGRVSRFDYHAASTGWETLLELHLARIFLPFTIGLRGSYVLDGLERKQNYEFFVTTLLGTF